MMQTVLIKMMHSTVFSDSIIHLKINIFITLSRENKPFAWGQWGKWELATGSFVISVQSKSPQDLHSETHSYI